MPDVSVPVMPITDFVFRDINKFGNRPALVSQQLSLFVLLQRQRRPVIFVHLIVYS